MSNKPKVAVLALSVVLVMFTVVGGFMRAESTNDGRRFADIRSSLNPVGFKKIAPRTVSHGRKLQTSGIRTFRFA